MSRPFLIGILLILVGLMAATSYAVQKQVKPEHEDAAAAAAAITPEQRKQADDDGKRKMMEVSRNKQEQEKQMRRQMADEQRKKPKGNTGMQIEGDWYKDKQDGQAGIDKALKEETKNAGPGQTPGTASGPSPVH